MKTINAIQHYWRGWFKRPGPSARIDLHDWRRDRDWSWPPKQAARTRCV